MGASSIFLGNDQGGTIARGFLGISMSSIVFTDYFHLGAGERLGETRGWWWLSDKCLDVWTLLEIDTPLVLRRNTLDT